MTEPIRPICFSCGNPAGAKWQGHPICHRCATEASQANVRANQPAIDRSAKRTVH